MKTDYLLRFINRVINEFQKGKDHGDEGLIIPISTKIPYCEVPYCLSHNLLANFLRNHPLDFSNFFFFFKHFPRSQ